MAQYALLLRWRDQARPWELPTDMDTLLSTAGSAPRIDELTRTLKALEKTVETLSGGHDGKLTEVKKQVGQVDERADKLWSTIRVLQQQVERLKK